MLLKTIAQGFNRTIKRSTDMIARWGGEEFIVLLPLTDQESAIKLAEKIQISIENTEIPLPDGKATRTTISAGVHMIYPKQDSSVGEFVSNADSALYAAKRSGRNKVVSYSEIS